MTELQTCEYIRRIGMVSNDGVWPSYERLGEPSGGKQARKCHMGKGANLDA
jgi:hypothetical protein